MPVLYIDLNKQDSLKKEPYSSFLKKYAMIEDDPDGKSIELRVGGKEGTFCNGFYIDDVFYIDPVLKVRFAKLSADGEGKVPVFIRISYCYEGEDGYDLDFHLQRIRDIRKRAEYFYIPKATHFEFSSQIDEDYSLMFDVIVESSADIPEVCCTLISHIIAIFSLDN